MFCLENAENTYPEEVKTVFICFCAQNMILPCQSLTEGYIVLISDLDLTFEVADVLLVPNTIHATQA